MLSLVMVFTACEKDGDDPVVPEQTPGELFPAYVGNWKNDSTYKNDVITFQAFQYNFDIGDVQATMYADRVGDLVHDSWTVSNGELTLNGTIGVVGTHKFTVTSPPDGNKMVLSTIPDKYNKDIFTYYLSK